MALGRPPVTDALWLSGATDAAAHPATIVASNRAPSKWTGGCAGVVKGGFFPSNIVVIPLRFSGAASAGRAILDLRAAGCRQRRTIELTRITFPSHSEPRVSGEAAGPVRAIVVVGIALAAAYQVLA